MPEQKISIPWMKMLSVPAASFGLIILVTALSIFGVDNKKYALANQKYVDDTVSTAVGQAVEKLEKKMEDTVEPIRKQAVCTEARQFLFNYQKEIRDIDRAGGARSEAEQKWLSAMQRNVNRYQIIIEQNKCVENE